MFVILFLQNDTLQKYLQPVSDKFLPDSEQYLPKLVSDILTSSKTSNIQLDLLLGTTSLEAINYNGS